MIKGVQTMATHTTIWQQEICRRFRFLKNEKKEAFLRQARKERDRIFLYIFQKLVTSEYVQTQLMTSGLGKAVRQIAATAGVSEKITSWILRCSQIIALREKLDPAWHLQVVEQCSHYIHTARQYYKYSSEIRPGMQAIEELTNIRETAQASEEELGLNNEVEDCQSVHPSLILEQYDELKLHFEISKDEEEKNYTADLLYQMYSDPANKLYLAFLQPVVSQVNRVNKLFESDRCNANRLLEDLMSLYKSILQRLMMPRTFCTWKAVADYDVNDERNHLPLEAVDFGVKFYIELGQSRLDSGIVHTVKKHGRDFLMKLLQELQQKASIKY
ncbi:hypothetical protein O3P69_012321 [Scylla paramamosain]|uniref:Uncharacterized protein n=1 Tax=Scylla paramamosain TaxID=85552 RepID=A0AAW0SGF6_SCYPA